MPREYPRARRIEEQIQRLLSDLVRREVKDPRVGPVTLTAVEVSKDLSHAKVYFLPFASDKDPAAVQQALNHAAGFLRSNLVKQLKLRHVPELRFVPDETIAKAVELSALISRAVRDDEARHVPDPEGEPAPADDTAAPEASASSPK
jgi:ribosome-binding factor A